MMKNSKIDLKQWKLNLENGKSPIAIPKDLPVSVPSCVHTDLQAQGIIPDPFLDDNERLLAWIGYCDWTYSTEFDAPVADKTVLVFEGLDTVAEVILNNQIIAAVKNMHRSYRFKVSNLLRPTGNQLVVRFKSPIKYADEMSLQLGYRPHVNHHPYNSIRKMAANFGWDWGIDTSTSGVWKPVYLQTYSQRIASVSPVTSVIGSTGVVDLTIDIDSVGQSELAARINLGGEVTEQRVQAGENKLKLSIPAVQTWAPNGSGDPNLYALRIDLFSGSEVVDQWEAKLGFRNLELEFPKDPDSTGFQFVLDGKPIFIRGVNWIPNHAFVHSISRAALFERLMQAKNANINLIRVWGGGMYESDDFYDICDELGLLVWQDFLFACAAYSEEDQLAREVEAEARENIQRIMRHPSLALWNGNNENLWGHQEWKWQERLQGKTWGAGYYFDLLPRLVTELDPGRPYTPGSPYSPVENKRHNDSRHGSVHIWDLWNEKDYPNYRNYDPRFVAEFGWQAPPSWSTMTAAIHDEPLTPESPGMIIHQKAMLGNDKLTDGLVSHFELPNNMDQWHWAMQLNQANAISTALRHFRARTPSCMGAIVWQLNDCWPVTSWAAIDFTGVEKPVYHSIAQAYEPVLLTFNSFAGKTSLHLINNSPTSVNASVKLARKKFSGAEEFAETRSISVEPGQNQEIELGAKLLAVADSSNEYLVAEINGHKTFWFFEEYKNSKLERPALDIEVTGEIGSQIVSVRSRNLVRDLTLLVDKIDPGARISSGMVTLEAGDSFDFEVSGPAQIQLHDLTDSVIRTANELVAR
jgi:beta-mannosidase